MAAPAEEEGGRLGLGYLEVGVDVIDVHRATGAAAGASVLCKQLRHHRA